jgi:hypothetical protein
VAEGLLGGRSARPAIPADAFASAVAARSSGDEIERDAPHSVVIEPFDAPQSFAARGLTGKVLAAGLLGELGRKDAPLSGAHAAARFACNLLIA